MKSVQCPQKLNISKHSSGLAGQGRRTLRIRNQFNEAKVDVVINADETFVLFHMQDHKLIVPTGIKRVRTAAQVDNEKVGATVLIACEFKTAMILPPMVIFTGVYGAKLMHQWEAFEDGKNLFSVCLIYYLFDGEY